MTLRMPFHDPAAEGVHLSLLGPVVMAQGLDKPALGVVVRVARSIHRIGALRQMVAGGAAVACAGIVNRLSDLATSRIRVINAPDVWRVAFIRAIHLVFPVRSVFTQIEIGTASTCCGMS